MNNIDNKPNDYFAASLNRPDLGLDQLFAVGLTPENTGLKDREYYKNIKQVQDKFTDSTGQFNEQAYNNYYEALQRSYNEFANTDFVNNWLNNIESSPYDIFSLDNPNSFDATVKMVRNSDPQRHQISMSGIGVVGNPSWDEREVAQENFVRDENGKKLNWTPNKKGFFGALLGPTLALATYDEDGYHVENGREVFHRKGQQKYDENGDPYYEILGDRPIYGKDILHVTDVISKDGSWFNRNIDFLDSDSLDKSIAKTIFKTATQIGLFAIPGVGPYLGAIKALMDFSSVLPVFAKSIDGFVTGNTTDPFGKSMTKWESMMARFDRSQTNYAKEHQWSWENVADMLGSSAGQLYSQRILGEGWMKMFAKNSKDLAKLQKTAQNISLGYMALTSAEESYSAFKNAGANDSVAGLGFILTAASMYGMMSHEYFKDWLFKDSAMNFDPEMRFTVRDFTKKWIDKLDEKLGFNVTKPTTQSQNEIFIKRWWNALKEFTLNHKDKIITGKAYPMTMAFANHALNEGVEETMEEVLMDLIKGLSLGAQALGFDVSEDNVEKVDFGFSPEEMMSRYLTSFVGGALGGTVFEGLTRWENYWKNPNVDNFTGMDVKRKLLWYISNGYESDLKKVLEREYRKKHLGNPNLSWSGKLTVDSAGNASWTADTSNGVSQNEQMFNLMNTVIDNLKYQAGQLKILDSDEEVAKLAIQFDDISKIAYENLNKAAQEEGISVEEYKRRHRTSLMERSILEGGADEFIFSDIWTLKDKILKREKDIKDIESKIRQNQNDSNKEQIDTRVNSDPDIKKLRSEQKKFQQEYADILAGKNKDMYIGLATMLHNDSLRDVYLKRDEDSEMLKSNNDLDLYTRLNYGESFASQTEAMQDIIREEYKEYITLKSVPLVRAAYDIHMRLLERNDPMLKQIKANLDGHIMDMFLESSTNLEFYKSLIPELSQGLTVMEEQYNTLSDEEKISEIGVDLNNKINRARAQVQALTTAVQSNDPTLLSRAISLDASESDNFNKGFLEDAGTSSYTIEETLDMLLKYFKYLRDNKVVFAYDNPILKNVELNILRKFRDVLVNEESGRLRHYMQESASELFDADVANRINNAFEYDELTGEIVDKFEKANGLERAEELAKKAGFLENYKAAKSAYLYQKQKDGFELTDAEKNYLLNSGINPEEIGKYVVTSFATGQFNIYHTDERFKSLSSGDPSTFPFLESTDNFFDVSNPNLTEFIDLVNKLTTNDIDFETFESDLNNLKQKILPHLKGEIKLDFEQNVFGILDNVVEKLKQAQELKAQLQQSPVIDLLRDVYIDVTGSSTPILDYLEQEIRGLRTPDALNAYVIDTDSERHQLQTIKDLLPVIDSLIQTTTIGGFNDTLNTYREPGQEPFVILDNSTIDLLTKELRYVRSRINTLLQFSNHAKSNVDQQISVQINMRPKYLERFITHVDQPGIPKRIYDDTESKIDLEALWIKAKEGTDVNITSLTKDNYNEFFKVLRKWEQLVHNAFKEEFKSLTKSQIGEKIASYFSDIENKSSEYNDDPDTKVSDLNLALYLMRIIGLDPSIYYSLYKTGALTDDYPFDGQEMVIGMGLVAALNKDMYNSIINTIKIDDSDADADQKEYISEMPILKSFIAILGGDGTGKSKIVTKKILDLLRLFRKTDIVATTAYERRLKDMKSELNIDSDNKLKLISEIIKQVNGKDFTPDDYILNKGHATKLKQEVIDKLDVSKFKELFDSNAEFRVLAIDEGTFASEAELIAFTSLAEKADVFVILNGDLNQQPTMREYYDTDNKGNIVRDTENKPVILLASNGLEDCKYGATPILSESVRVSNKGMRVSRQALRDAVNIAVKYAKDNPAKYINEIIENVQDVDITFQYHETNDNFAGIKIINNETDATNYVSKFDKLTKISTSKPSVGIITDSNKYDALANDNIEIIQPKAVQGQEYDYVIVDVDLSKSEYDARFNRLKSINTWLSRAKRGAVIISKPEMQIKDNKGHFMFTSSDIDTAIISIDSKRDNPEQFKAYKEYIDILYTDVEPYKSDEVDDTSEEDGGEAEGGGSQQGGDEQVYAGGQQSVTGDNPEEQIDEILTDVLNGTDDTDGYRDESNYKFHHDAINNKERGLYSLENFYNWLYNDESDKNIFADSFSPFKGYDEGVQNAKQNIKRFIQGVAFVMAQLNKSDASEYFENHRGTMEDLIKSITSYSPDLVLNCLIDGLKDRNNCYSAFVLDQNTDDSALIWLVFGNDSSTFKIPIGSVFGQYDESKVYDNITFKEKYPMSIISTKGLVHTPIGSNRFSQKVHLNRFGGIFIPITKESDFSDDMPNSARNFYRSKGRFYNIWDLNIFSSAEQDRRIAEEFFKSSFDSNNRLIDFTQHTSNGELRHDIRIKGTHKLIRFDKYIQLEKIIQKIINPNQNKELDASERNLIKTVFGLKDEDINILSTTGSFWDSVDTTRYNAAKKEINGRSDLLNYISRANLFSALLRISMKWMRNEDAKKSGFASTFLTNFLIHFLLGGTDSQNSHSYTNKNQDQYTNGLTLSLSGKGLNYPIRLEYFVYVNNGKIVIEKAEDKSSPIQTELEIKKYLSAEKGYDVHQLGIDLLKALSDVISSSNIHAKTNAGEFTLNSLLPDLNEESIDELFGNGSISLIPSKRYIRSKPAQNVPTTSYYVAFDSEIADMIPDDNRDIIALIEEELKADNVFKYGMYAIEKIVDNEQRDGTSEFSIKSLLSEEHLTDIGDIMLPGYDMDTEVADAEKSVKIMQKINRKTSTGTMADSSAYIDGNTITFIDKPLLVNKNELITLIGESEYNSLKSSIGDGLIEISSFAINSKELFIKVGPNEYSVNFNKSIDWIKNWLLNNGVTVSINGEIRLYENNGIALYKTGNRFELFLNNKRSTANLIGVVEQGSKSTLYFYSNDDVIPITIDTNEIIPLGKDVYESFDKFITLSKERGQFLLKDAFGFYYFKDDKLIFYENDHGTIPAERQIVKVSDDEIRLDNGDVLTKNSFIYDEILLFSKIKALYSRLMLDDDLIITKINNLYRIKNVIVTPEWINNVVSLDSLQEVATDINKEVNLISFDLTNKTITIADGNNEISLALSNEGIEWMNSWLRDKQITTPDKKIMKFFNNAIWLGKEGRTLLQRIVQVYSNSNNPIQDINSELLNMAGMLGGLYELDTDWSLREKVDTYSLAWVAIKSKFKSDNVELVENGDSYWIFSVTDQESTTLYKVVHDGNKYSVQSYDDKNEIVQRIKQMIQNASTEDQNNLINIANHVQDATLIRWKMMHPEYKNIYEQISKISESCNI